MSDDAGKTLVGTWRLLSVHLDMADGDERVHLLGPNPTGQMIVTADQMVCILTDTGDGTSGEERQRTAPMFYAGKYRIEEGDKLVVRCDVAWNPAWIGTDQVRAFEIQGNRLAVRSGLLTHPVRPGRQGYGVIDWVREA